MRALKFSIPLLTLTFANCLPTLLYEDKLPDLTAAPNKALVVYMRTIDMPDISYSTRVGANGGTYTVTTIDDEGTESKIYVDGKYVGGTTSGCLTTFEVEPGPHILSACDDFCGRMKINAIKGKVYFVEEMPFPMGPLGTKFNIQFISMDEADQKLKQIKYRYSKPNPENREDDLDADDAKDELDDWNEWAADNPEKAKVEEGYPGY